MQLLLLQMPFPPNIQMEPYPVRQQMPGKIHGIFLHIPVIENNSGIRRNL